MNTKIDETNPAEVVDLLIEEIKQKREKELASQIKLNARQYFYASDIPDCDKYMTHSILDWKERQLHNEYVQARFNEGNKQERKVIAELLDLGYEIIEQQVPIEIKNRKGEILARGRIDGKIKRGSIKFPLEIKSMNPNIYAQIEKYDDLDKKSWLRKYKRQMQIYLWGHEIEAGILLLTDCLGHWKLIPVILDYDKTEFIIKRLERNFDLVQKKQHAKGMDFSPENCGMCNFSHICLPDIKNRGAELIDNPSTEQDLERRKELKPARDEYEKIDKSLKTFVKAIDNKQMVVGEHWIITRKVTPTNKVDSKTMPDDVKAPYMKKGTMTNIDFYDLRDEKQKAKLNKKK